MEVRPHRKMCIFKQKKLDYHNYNAVKLPTFHNNLLVIMHLGQNSFFEGSRMYSS